MNDFSLVEVLPNEDIFNVSSPLFTRAYIYRLKGIKDAYGYTLEEWLNLPRHLQDILVEASDKFEQDKPKVPDIK